MSQQKVSRNLAQVKRGVLHIGVDLGLENNVAIVISEHAKRLDRFRFSNDRDGYEYFQQRINKLQRENTAPEVMVAMEPTNYLWKLLASDLEQKGIAYRLVNAYTVKKHREGDQCWDTHLICTPYFDPSLVLRDPLEINSGFNK